MHAYLRFAEKDVDLIRHGMDTRQSRTQQGYEIRLKRTEVLQ